MSDSAEFRARRERCGLTQQDVADALRVRTMTVKRWEKPTENDAPADAWEFIEAVEAARKAVVKQAEEAALANAGGGAVQLTYYRTQEQFDEMGRDEGPVGVANANARAVADRLEAMGFEVGWAYPDEPGNVYHRPDGGVFIVTAHERVLSLLGNGDIRDQEVSPYSDPDVIYEGPSLEEARAEAEAFAAAHPWEFEAHGLAAVVSYWSIEGALVGGEDEWRRVESLCISTLTDEGRDRLERYADDVDEAAEELGY